MSDLSILETQSGFSAAHSRILVGTLIGALLAVCVCWGISELTNPPTVYRDLTTKNGHSTSDVGRLNDVELSLQGILEIESPSQRQRSLSGWMRGLDSSQIIDLIEESSDLDGGRKLDSIQDQLFR